MVKEFSKRGKLNRASGARFELKVRGELERDGWIVDKWTNNVDLDEGKLVKARRKFNPYLKVLGIGTGFPDFVCFKRKGKGYEIIGVEVKRNGWLDKGEKDKCKWLVENGVFSDVLIAKAVREGRRINVEYLSFVRK